MAIYTKNGDAGKTSNALGKVYSKGSVLIELQGNIDEINANVGLLRCKLSMESDCISEHKRIDEFLKKVQYNLFLIGVEVSMEFSRVDLKNNDIEGLESEIDYMTEKLNPLKNFIYQSGSEPAAYAHVTRNITRRCEREFVRALEGGEYPYSYRYINRLSDYFFTLARYLNYINGQEEEVLIIK